MRRSCNQRGPRRAPRIRRGPSRILASCCAGVLLCFLLGAATVAAASPRPPAAVPAHGDGYEAGQGSKEEQDSARELRAFLDALLDRLRHRESTEGMPPPEMTPTPPTTEAPAPTTSPTTPPTTRPAPAPATTPPASGGLSGQAASTPAGANAAATATVVPASGGVAAAGRAVTGAAQSGSGAGAPPASPPPQTSFPFPAPGGHGSVIRALRTAGSYGLLFALIGAVVVFLAIQGRVDRRDPRIARAPVDAHLDFRDLE